jgi:hypothetical protein
MGGTADEFHGAVVGTVDSKSFVRLFPEGYFAAIPPAGDDIQQGSHVITNFAVGWLLIRWLIFYRKSGEAGKIRSLAIQIIVKLKNLWKP